MRTRCAADLGICRPLTVAIRPSASPAAPHDVHAETAPASGGAPTCRGARICEERVKAFSRQSCVLLTYTAAAASSADAGRSAARMERQRRGRSGAARMLLRTRPAEPGPRGCASARPPRGNTRGTSRAARGWTGGDTQATRQTRAAQGPGAMTP